MTDTALVRFSEGADYLIYDATYQVAEYESLRRGWGHSTWAEGARIATELGVRKLILFHHDPDRTDRMIDGLVRLARKSFRDTVAASEGLALEIPPRPARRPSVKRSSVRKRRR